MQACMHVYVNGSKWYYCHGSVQYSTTASPVVLMQWVSTTTAWTIAGTLPDVNQQLWEHHWRMNEGSLY